MVEFQGYLFELLLNSFYCPPAGSLDMRECLTPWMGAVFRLLKSWVIFASTTAIKFASDFSLLFKTNLRVVMQAVWALA